MEVQTIQTSYVIGILITSVILVLLILANYEPSHSMVPMFYGPYPSADQAPMVSTWQQQTTGGLPNFYAGRTPAGAFIGRYDYLGRNYSGLNALPGDFNVPAPPSCGSCAGRGPNPSDIKTSPGTKIISANATSNGAGGGTPTGVGAVQTPPNTSPQTITSAKPPGTPGPAINNAPPSVVGIPANPAQGGQSVDTHNPVGQVTTNVAGAATIQGAATSQSFRGYDANRTRFSKPISNDPMRHYKGPIGSGIPFKRTFGAAQLDIPGYTQTSTRLGNVGTLGGQYHSGAPGILGM